MKPLKEFEEYVKNGVVKKTVQDINRSRSLIKESIKRMNFLDKMIESMGITDENANYVVEISYDAVMEKIRAAMFKNGFSASGQGAHEAEVSYAKRLNLTEMELRFLNELRYWRNGILYYGKDSSTDYAKDVYEFAKKIYSKITGN